MHEYNTNIFDGNIVPFIWNRPSIQARSFPGLIQAYSIDYYRPSLLSGSVNVSVAWLRVVRSKAKPKNEAGIRLPRLV